MIDEVIKMKQNKNIVSIFCDETDSTTFLEGYIYAVGVQKFLIKHITPHGLADGYILKELDSIVHLEDNILQICMNNEYITSFEMVEDDECPIKGTIKELDSNKVIVSKLTEDGEEDGEAVLKKENIDTISFLGVDEEDIEILRGVNRSF